MFLQQLFSHRKDKDAVSYDAVSFFSAKRYSEKYKEHIKKIIAELEDTSIVCITLQADIFCEGCPSSLQDGSCSVADRVREYDQKILEECGWKEEMLLPYSEFKQTKILSFHQEEGFVQKEFTDRDELRCFLLAVSGIYRIQ